VRKNDDNLYEEKQGADRGDGHHAAGSGGTERIEDQGKVCTADPTPWAVLPCTLFQPESIKEQSPKRNVERIG
jgi:hypothetical protein